MKTKKHHNSFRPDLGFFIGIMEVQRWIQQDEELINEHVAVSHLLPMHCSLIAHGQSG
jgi:aprataxin